MTPDERKLKSYIWHGDQCFFVSTIQRDSDISAAPGMTHAETITWTFDWESQVRGEQLAINRHNHDALWCHQEMCSQLFKTGTWSSEITDAAKELRKCDIRQKARDFVKEYRNADNDSEKGRYAAPTGLWLAHHILGDEYDRMMKEFDDDPKY